ncbi:unnamed protein product [Phytomonas sp. EM1]|nr:unnamed protein product [Phytomonas sp. EM1]|eukprot:CCW63088.1 unnamed protein product [Phytomonas sp. isolate EM1]
MTTVVSTSGSFNGNCGVSPSSAPTEYPTLECISAFMMRLSAKLSAAHCIEIDHDHPRLIASYDYTGCDYAMVLHALLPNKCVDLSRLCWSPQPLATQLMQNLEELCEAVKRLDTLDMPLSSIEPQRLLPTAACILHHLKLQQWLYTLSKRFLPDPAFDAASVRAVLRLQQLGEPYLRRRKFPKHTERVSAACTQVGEDAQIGLSLRETSIKPLSDVLDFSNFENDPEVRCRSVEQTPCINATILRGCLAPYLASTPPYTPEAIADAQMECNGKAVGDCNDPSCSTPSNSMNASNSHMNTTTVKPKAWLNYSKPWRLPAGMGAKEKRAKAAAARRQEALLRNPVATAFAHGSSNLREQYEASERGVKMLRDNLVAVRREVMEEILSGKKTFSFERYAEMLTNAALRTEDS